MACFREFHHSFEQRIHPHSIFLRSTARPFALGSFFDISLITFFYAFSCFETNYSVALFSMSSIRMNTPRPLTAASKCFKRILAIVAENFSLFSPAPSVCAPTVSAFTISLSIRWMKGCPRSNCFCPFSSEYVFCTYLSISSTRSEELASPTLARPTKRFFITVFGFVDYK